MTAACQLADHLSVLLYGVVLSFSFAGKLRRRQEIYRLFVVLAFFLFLEIVIYSLWGHAFLQRVFPLFCHVPLLLLLVFCCHVPLRPAMLAVLSAFLMCTPRLWLGSMAAVLLGDTTEVICGTRVLVTGPLLYFFCRYFSPYLQRLGQSRRQAQRFFLVVLLLYYIMEYLFRLYLIGPYHYPAVMELVNSLFVLLYLVLVVNFIEKNEHLHALDIEQHLFDIQSRQIQGELSKLREADQQTRIYRHDLRHHLQIILGMVEHRQREEVIRYIESICDRLDRTKLVRYSENEDINLILSAYMAKAKAAHIACEADIRVAEIDHVAMADLCMILANALENAIHAAAALPEPQRFIRVQVWQDKKLRIEIRNSCRADLILSDTQPQGRTPGHGIGTLSIIAAVGHYQGICRFQAEHGVFRLQILL